MEADLVRQSAVELAGAIARGEVSAEEVTRAHLDRIAAVDGEVHAFLQVLDDQALEVARGVDRKRAAGDSLGPLAGVPLALKDVLTMSGVPTTCGSRILEGWRPPYDCDRRRAPARGRRGHPRQDQHGRVRHGLVH